MFPTLDVPQEFMVVLNGNLLRNNNLFPARIGKSRDSLDRYYQPPGVLNGRMKA